LFDSGDSGRLVLSRAGTLDARGYRGEESVALLAMALEVSEFCAAIRSKRTKEAAELYTISLRITWRTQGARTAQDGMLSSWAVATEAKAKAAATAKVLMLIDVNW
jgi:hypothetical protein